MIPTEENTMDEPNKNRILTDAEWTEQDERDRWLDEMDDDGDDDD
jgi:hypothetical protein